MKKIILAIAIVMVGCTAPQSESLYSDDECHVCEIPRDACDTCWREDR